MSLANMIFFAGFIIFLLSGVGLAFGRLIVRILTEATDQREERKTGDQLQADDTVRPWQALRGSTASTDLLDHRPGQN